MEEDKVLIKHYRVKKKYGRKKLIKEFPEKNWRKTGLRKLFNKIDGTGDTHKKNKAAKGRERVDQMKILTLSET